MSASGDPQLEPDLGTEGSPNATWNIERRSAAGRSTADVAVSGRSRASTKAEQMTRGSRGPAVFQCRSKSVSPAGCNAACRRRRGCVRRAPMGLAAELDGDKTKEAIPHEMAALRGPPGAGRGPSTSSLAAGQRRVGSGRTSGTGLSALFDKELQRQQRTTTDALQIEERPDHQEEDSALDRIRDLARRQEDLSSRERELAQSQVSPEEKKRQLERLTREQQELRERAESLGRQLEASDQSHGSASSRSCDVLVGGGCS